MPIPNDRDTPFDFTTLSQLFNEYNGYYDLANQELARTLVRWDLLEEKNRKDVKLAYCFMKWSFTVSFLEFINALQWFLAGVLLDRLAYLPAQVMQLYYYSIFFSYGSFLSAHGKGHYTVKVEWDENRERKERKEVWLAKDEQPNIFLKDKGRGGEHEIRAKWFHEVFKKWDKKDDHPAVIVFQNDRTFHSSLRNMFTYSLADMAEELFHSPEDRSNLLTDKILLDLWDRDDTLPDFFPEAFWALEHIKAVVDIHSKLLENYAKKTPYTSAQIVLVKGILSHHERTSMNFLLQAILEPILSHMKL